MTTPIEYTQIETNTLLAGGSRYMSQNVIYYGENKLLTFDTYLRKDRIATGKEKIMMISPGVEYRPDLVSFDVYGFPDAWWNILEANKMKDVFEFTSGKTIILPQEVL